MASPGRIRSIEILEKRKETSGFDYYIRSTVPANREFSKKQEKILQNNSDELGFIYGPLYSLIHFNHINQKYEKAVMLAIRPYLHHFVVDTRDTILNCIKFSKENNLPRTTFFALSEFESQAPQTEQFADYPGLIGCASSIVKCDSLIANLNSHLLSKVLIF